MESSKGRIVADDEQLDNTVKSLEEALKSLESHLTPFFAVPLEELTHKLDDTDIAKLNVVMAYAINTLFYVYLKTQGVSPTNHPVKHELERVKLYIKKMKEITDKKNGKKDENTTRINVDAANRFIKHSLAGNKAEEE